MPGDPRMSDDDALAAALRAASARLAAADLPPATRARLQRLFIGICDAAKWPGASTAVCQRRLDKLLVELETVLSEKP